MRLLRTAATPVKRNLLLTTVLSSTLLGKKARPNVVNGMSVRTFIAFFELQRLLRIT